MTDFTKDGAWETAGERFHFKESVNTSWFIQKHKNLLTERTCWMIWAEFRGQLIQQTLELKRRLSMDMKQQFGIK